MKLLPFDLEKALKGQAVVTRDHSRVRWLHTYHPACSNEEKFNLVGVIDLNNNPRRHGSLQNWQIDGRYSDVLPDHPYDLFLLDETIPPKFTLED